MIGFVLVGLTVSYVVVGLVENHHRNKKFKQLNAQAKNLLESMWLSKDDDNIFWSLSGEVNLVLEAMRRLTDDVLIFSPHQWWKKWNRDYLAEVKKEKEEEKRNES